MRRIGRLVTPGRAGGLLGMLASGYLLTVVTGPAAFDLVEVELPELHWTEASAVMASVGLQPGANLFQLRTGPIEARLRELPAVAAAEVRVSLVDASVVVSLEERQPILGWLAGETVHLVDGDGVVVATRPAAAAGSLGLPTVADRRSGASTGLAIGGRLDPVDLDVATRLASLVPADVGSAAAALAVTVSDREGYVVSTADWDAIFGFYGPATRSPEIIPGQVRLLRSLLAGREAEVRRIILASATDGTYVPRTTPRPTRR